MAKILWTRKGSLIIAAFTPAVVFLIAVWGGAVPKAEHSHGMELLPRAAFVQDGSVSLPMDYRQWVHIGTRIKVGGLNILDGTKLTTPQVLNAYVEPSAFIHYKKTGAWADGTQIVKEISVIKVGKDCDTATLLCTTALGTGIFEAQYTGIGMMVKDSKRFAKEPGNWGYFAFFRKGAGFESLATVRSQNQCASCHVKLASDTDYVISKAHLALQEDKLP